MLLENNTNEVINLIYQFDNLSNIDISSTYIRENINNKKLLVDKIDKEIYDYIVYNKLYEVIK